MSKYVIIERREISPYCMLNHETYMQPVCNAWATPEEIQEAEAHFDQTAVELNNFEYEMFEQYKEMCCAFNALCIRKLAQRKPAVYELMSRIYGVFEKYGIEAGHRDEFAFKFVNNYMANRPKYLRIGEGKFRGQFLYGHSLRYNLDSSSARAARKEAAMESKAEANREDQDQTAVSQSLNQTTESDLRTDKRVRLVNGELVSFEKEFKIVVLNKLQPAQSLNQEASQSLNQQEVSQSFNQSTAAE